MSVFRRQVGGLWNVLHFLQKKIEEFTRSFVFLPRIWHCKCI
jgi:hypothetical protein